MAEQAGDIPPEPVSLEDLRSYVAWMKHTHPELTQRRVAELAGVSKSAVARLELGHEITYPNGVAILRALIEHHRASLVDPEEPVHRIMSSPVEAAYSTWTLDRLYDEMATRRFSYMPFKDKQRRYVGLIHRETVAALLAAGAERDDRIEEHLDELLQELAPVVGHEEPVHAVASKLKRGPGIRLVERWGQVRGVVTEDNLRRVRWSG